MSPNTINYSLQLERIHSTGTLACCNTLSATLPINKCLAVVAHELSAERSGRGKRGTRIATEPPNAVEIAHQVQIAILWALAIRIQEIGQTVAVVVQAVIACYARHFAGVRRASEPAA